MRRVILARVAVGLALAGAAAWALAARLRGGPPESRGHGGDARATDSTAARDPKSPRATTDAAAGQASERDGGEAREGLVSLLAWTDSRVAVSSTVDNPHDFPEHLIDAKADTAWNGKTGDLAGYIAFRVPKEAHVERVRITCGFDRVAKDGRDLFTANHRIKRLRVTRDGALLREVTLDTNRRDLQTIDLDSDGGDFRLEVLETVPGTVAAWRELVVSELQVLGDPRTARRTTAHMPRVRVGSLDAAEWDAASRDAPSPAPDGSLDAYCKWFVKTHEAEVRAVVATPEFPCQEVDPHATCESTDERALTSSGAFRAIAVVHQVDAKTSSSDYAVVGKSGAFTVLGGDAMDRCVMGDPGTDSYKLVSVDESKTASGEAQVVVVADSVGMWPMYTDPETGGPGFFLQASVERELIVCHANGTAAPACDSPVVLGKFNGRLDATGTVPPFETWDDHKSFTIATDGGVVLTPSR